MESGVSWVNICTVFMRPMGRSIVLLANVTFEPVTTRINVWLLWQLIYFVMDIWGLRTPLLMNVFNEILQIFQRYIQNLVQVLLLIVFRCVVIWHFCPVLSAVYLSPEHFVDLCNRFCYSSTHIAVRRVQLWRLVSRRQRRMSFEQMPVYRRSYWQIWTLRSVFCLWGVQLELWWTVLMGKSIQKDG